MQVSKKIARFLDLRSPRLTIWFSLRNALIVAYILIGGEKFRYKYTGCVILKYTGPRTDFLALYYDCKYVNYGDNTVIITNVPSCKGGQQLVYV